MKLRTGTVFEVGGAGNEIVGLSADLEVTSGYDVDPAQWHPPVEGDPDWEPPAPQLTTEEKIDVCDVMIGRWQRLRERLEREGK